MPQWTNEQLAAIHTRGSDLLVSAAAGSGKTAVLSARVGEYVEQGGSLDRLLVVTFTNLAAGEMRTRIARDLSARAAAKPGDVHLRRQSLTLYKAKICTIDSFGLDLLRRNFQAADVAPDFTVLDETELTVLKTTVLRRMLEACYGEFPQGFGDFLELFGGDTDSKRMETTVLSVAQRLETVPFPDRWVQFQKDRLSSAAQWCAAVCELLLPLFADYRDIYRRVLSASPFTEKGMSTLREEAALVEDLCAALSEGRWDDACRTATSFSFSRAPSCKEGMPDEAFLYKEYRPSLKALLEQEVFFFDTALCERDLAQLRPGMLFLLDFVEQFRLELLAEMHRRGGYSFSALSDLALRLVVSDYSFGTGDFTPTPIALRERENYDEILIDEYQDVNDLQDLFFRAVSHNNCFAVGDVKQSIYRFRGANAGNFLRKKATCRVIALNRNFRSRKGILDYVNFLCRGLFSPQMGGIVYDEGETLFPGRKDDDALAYPADAVLPQPDAELLLIPTPYRLGEDDPDKSEGEALLCAKLIRDAVEGGATVYDKNENARRPMRYSDVAVLLRSYKSSVEAYEEVFRRCGIPLLPSDGGVFLDSPEVCGLLAFLKAVNNPWEDVALFVTLTGNVFSFSPQQVAEVRLCAPKKPLWEGLKEYAKTHEEGQTAIDVLSRFRILSENLPVARLIWEIYTATDYLSLESVIDPNARGNLMKFYAFARRYPKADGLFGFLDFAEKARLSGNVRESSAAPEGDFVRIMSIHRSKGLEFAWCILPELEKRFVSDRDAVRVDAQFGVGCKVRNASGTAEYTTLMRELIGLRESRGEIAEQLRVLYVALTRARDRLTLIGRCSDHLERLDLHGLHSKEGQVRFSTLASASDFRSFVLDRTVFHPKATALHSAYGSPEQSETEPLRVAFVSVPEQIAPVSARAERTCGLSREELERRFSFRYDTHLSAVPAKVSVTEISKQPPDPDSALLLSAPVAVRPKFLDERALTAAEMGTALHTYCQFAEYSAPVEEEIARLTAAGHLTPAAAEGLDRTLLTAFLQSDLAAFLKTALNVEREVRFVCPIPVSYYSGNPGEEGEMLMQGAIDLLCETEEGYLIVDFKSDRASEEELLARYSRQVNLYAAAVRRLYDKPVIGCKLWSFRLKRALDVPEGEL